MQSVAQQSVARCSVAVFDPTVGGIDSVADPQLGLRGFRERGRFNQHKRWVIRLNIIWIEY